MATIVNSGGGSATKTISGTAALYVVGPPKTPTLYNGDAQGVYLVSGSTTYRWIHDEARSAGSGPRTAFAAK